MILAPYAFHVETEAASYTHIRAHTAYLPESLYNEFASRLADDIEGDTVNSEARALMVDPSFPAAVSAARLKNPRRSARRRSRHDQSHRHPIVFDATGVPPVSMHDMGHVVTRIFHVFKILRQEPITHTTISPQEL